MPINTQLAILQCTAGYPAASAAAHAAAKSPEEHFLASQVDLKSAAAAKNEAGQFDKLNKLFGSPRQARLKTAPIRWALQAIFLTRTRDDWARLLETRDCCVTPILSIDESLKNEHILARGMIEDDNGKPAFAFPVRFSEALKPAHPAPKLGADNDAVLGAKL